MDKSENGCLLREVIKNPDYDDETKIKMIEEEYQKDCDLYAERIKKTDEKIRKYAKRMASIREKIVDLIEPNLVKEYQKITSVIPSSFCKVDEEKMDNTENNGFIREVIKNSDYDDETKIKMIEEEYQKIPDVYEEKDEKMRKYEKKWLSIREKIGNLVEKSMTEKYKNITAVILSSSYKEDDEKMEEYNKGWTDMFEKIRKFFYDE